MSSWKKHFKPVKSVVPSQYSDSGYTIAANKYNNWLPEVYVGPPDRLQRYNQYELMNLDHEISAALDTIAEFSTQPDVQNDLPFVVKYKEDPTPQEVKIIHKYLQNWCKLNDLTRRVFRVFRSTLMYGDQFFIRDPETYKLYWVDPNKIEKIVVNESEGKRIEAYYVKDLDLNLKKFVTTNQTSDTIGGHLNVSPMFPGVGLAHNYIDKTQPTILHQGHMANENGAFPIDAAHVVHISLTEGFDGAWPFGISVLETIYKVFKQKELLEDAILIYRIHRAPERRIFKIDTGTLPPNKSKQFVEQLRFEVQQKRIPNRGGGGSNVIDSAYNPLSTMEDYFFAVGPDGRGSSVETLPGGENLGQIDDLKYWNNKMLRALGVPSSYLPTGPDDGTANKNDGAVGTAFIQEFRFSEKCKRHQRQVIQPLDMEFKLFLKYRGITIDNSLFELQFNEPQNFAKYRQIELDAASLNVFNAVAEIPFVSKRFALKRYLGWTQEEIMMNEKMLLEERLGDKAPPDNSNNNIGLRQAGIPSSDFAGGDQFDDLSAEDIEGTDELGAEDTGEPTDTAVSQDEIDNFGEQ